MFKGTRKAIERAPRWISGQHVKDPEVQIWTKDFHAAKVALNSLDRECKQQEINETEFLRLSLDLYYDFVNVRNCDQAEGQGAVPATTAAFAPIQSAMDDIKMRSHSHTVKMHDDIDELRSLLHKVEEMVHKTDRKKQDCEAAAHKHEIDYDDPSSQNIPEIQTYLQYHYHILSLVPQVLTQLDAALKGLTQRQLGHQMYVFQTAQMAIISVLAELQLPSSVDSIDILQRWTTEVEPVVSSLSKTRTIGKAAVLPPPPSTWQKLKNPPGAHSNYANQGSVGQQTKLLASNVGNSFQHGISYIYPVDVKFFNPRKGIFGEKEEYELKLASQGKEVEQVPSAINASSTTAAKAPEATDAPSSPQTQVPAQTTAEAPTTTQAPAAAPAAVPTQSVPVETATTTAAPVTAPATTTSAPTAVSRSEPAPPATAPPATTTAPASTAQAAPAVTHNTVPAAATAVPVSVAQPTATVSAVPSSPTTILTASSTSTQPVTEFSTEVLSHTGIAAPARASATPSLKSVDEHPSEGSSFPTASTTPEGLEGVNAPENNELL